MKNAINSFLIKLSQEEPSDFVGVISNAAGKIRQRVERRRDIRKKYGGSTPRRQDNSYFGGIKTLFDLKRQIK